MRPRFFPTAQAELEQINVALRRAYEPPPPPPKRPAFSFGPILYILGLLLLAGVLLHPWQKSVDPLGDAKLNNAKPIPRAELIKWNPHVPRATLVNLGEPLEHIGTVNWGDTFWVMMPDGRWIVVTAMGRANRVEELPLTGNRIGDARWVGDSCFVWLNPIGLTIPTWIDP